MPLKLYNTLGREKQEFKPLEKGKIKMYYCGPTVYWTQHIGNLRGRTMVDLVVRSLQYLGYDVNFVSNYTDVGHLTSDSDEGEDKMEKGVQREGLSPQEIADKYIKIYEKDVTDLNIQPPQKMCRATDYIQHMQDLVKTLLDKGYAYTTDLAVYFDVSKAKDYTRLSGQNLDELMANAGTGDVEDSGKKSPLDFSLWFFKAGTHKNALQTWPSSFESPLVENGEGFPGWHIECSAMSQAELGDTVDIHMGGIEHVPIHHTNEIAQSESASGKPFANYWIHNGHLLVDDRKMAKSEGTGYSLQEIKDKGYDPLVLRYFFLQAQYRSKQNFTWDALEAAKNGFEHLQNQVRELGTEKGSVNKDFKKTFSDSLSDDINVPQALAVISEVLKSDSSNEDKLATVLDFDQVLGLDLDNVHEQETIPQDIKELAEKREQARQDKDYDTADQLRKQIEDKGYEVEDSGGGYRINKK